MSVTITIKVEDGEGAAAVSLGDMPGMMAMTSDEVGGGAGPAPTLMGAPGEAQATGTGDGGDGPPPMDPSELGLSAATAATAEGDGPPPLDELVEGGESDEAESLEPMPMEDLNQPSGKSSKSKKG